MKNFFSLLPFYIPLINLISILFSISFRIDIVICFLYMIAHIIEVIRKKTINKLFLSIYLLVIFIFFHTIYSFLAFPHIFNTILTVNIQLIIFLEILLFYSVFPIKKELILRGFSILNIFGLINVFFLTTSYFGYPLIKNEDVNFVLEDRYFGVIGDQEAWIFSMFSFIYFEKKNRLYSYIYLIALLLTGSITASLILVVAVLIKIFSQVKLQFRLFYFLVIFFTTPLLIAVLSQTKIFFISRLINSDFSESATFMHRKAALENAFNLIFDNFILGFGNFAAEIFYRYDNILSASEKGTLTFLGSSNNQYIDFILNYGLIGLFFFVYFLFSIFKNISLSITLANHDSYKNKSRLFYIWLLSFLFVNQSAIWFIPGSFIFICFILFISLIISQFLCSE